MSRAIGGEATITVSQLRGRFDAYQGSLRQAAARILNRREVRTFLSLLAPVSEGGYGDLRLPTVGELPAGYRSVVGIMQNRDPLS